MQGKQHSDEKKLVQLDDMIVDVDPAARRGYRSDVRLVNDDNNDMYGKNHPY